MFMITQKGEEQLANAVSIPSRLNGWKYQNIAYHFWGRLNLLIQTLSYILHKETRFYPIQRDSKIQQAVKKILHKNHQNREEMAARLFQELVDTFRGAKRIASSNFCKKINGNESRG